MPWRQDEPVTRWLRYIPRRLRGLVKFSLCLLLLAGLGFLLFILRYYTLAKQYDIKQVGQLPQRNIVYDRYNNEIDAIIGSNIELITFENLPPFLVKALQAREDATFFTHSGIDLKGLIRATFRNIKDRKFTQGASTLSMQLARNTYEIRAKSLHRKFLEIALTLRVEKNYTKQEIMAGYLNRIYFGVGAGHLGIQDASINYFGKSVSKLNNSECAMLIGIIRGPHIFSPWRDLKAAKHQRNQVLNRMVAMNFINENDKETIIATPVVIAVHDEMTTEKSYAIQAVVNEITNLLPEEDIQLGGLKIYTTLDMPWQRRLETELRQTLDTLENDKTYVNPTMKNYSPPDKPQYLQMTAVSLETRTGAIFAQIGGRNFEHSRFDRTKSAKRDLGSAFELFVIAAAAERNKPIYLGSPVRTGKGIGTDEVAHISRRCGLNGPFMQTEDLYRGSVSATPIEMAVGLATIGNKGKRPRPFLIREVKDTKGEIVFQNKPIFFEALKSSSAQKTLDTLSGATGTTNFTGSTGSEREAWTLRLGPKSSTAIWVGFDQPKIIINELRLKSFLTEIVSRLDNN
jgi:membrane peptidoglycan carboxypeptidase